MAFLMCELSHPALCAVPVCRLMRAWRKAAAAVHQAPPLPPAARGAAAAAVAAPWLYTHLLHTVCQRASWAAQAQAPTCQPMVPHQLPPPLFQVLAQIGEKGHLPPPSYTHGPHSPQRWRPSQKLHQPTRPKTPRRLPLRVLAGACPSRSSRSGRGSATTAASLRGSWTRCLRSPR